MHPSKLNRWIKQVKGYLNTIALLFPSKQGFVCCSIIPTWKKKEPGDSDRRSLEILEKHLGLCFSINNAYEHLSFLKFDLGSSIGTSSFDLSFFKNWALQIKLALCKCKVVLKSELQTWLKSCRRIYSSICKRMKIKTPLNSKGNNIFFFLLVDQSSWRWRKLLWPLFPGVIEHHLSHVSS